MRVKVGQMGNNEKEELPRAVRKFWGVWIYSLSQW
jgi:hypothetical protein